MGGPMGIQLIFWKEVFFSFRKCQYNLRTCLPEKRHFLMSTMSSRIFFGTIQHLSDFSTKFKPILLIFSPRSMVDAEVNVGSNDDSSKKNYVVKKELRDKTKYATVGLVLPVDLSGIRLWTWLDCFSDYARRKTLCCFKS